MRKTDIELIAGIASLVGGLSLKFLKKDNIKFWKSSVLGSDEKSGLLPLFFILTGVVLLGFGIDNRLYPEKEEQSVVEGE